MIAEVETKWVNFRGNFGKIWGVLGYFLGEVWVEKFLKSF